MCNMCRIPYATTPLPILQMPTWQFSSKRKQRQDGRVLLLFDINGVLMQHTWDGVSHKVGLNTPIAAAVLPCLFMCAGPGFRLLLGAHCPAAAAALDHCLPNCSLPCQPPPWRAARPAAGGAPPAAPGAALQVGEATMPLAQSGCWLHMLNGTQVG